MLRYLLALALVVAIPASACSEPQNAGTLVVSIGMPVTEFREKSTYPVPTRPDGELGLFCAGQRVNVLYTEGNRRLEYYDIGGEGRWCQTILSRFGKVKSIDIQPQTQVMTLDESFEQIKRAYDWFYETGYRAKDQGVGFSVSLFYESYSPYDKPVRSLGDARTAFLDKEAHIPDATVFALYTADGKRGAYATLKSARRMQAEASRAFGSSRSDERSRRLNDESNLLTEREYFLTIGIDSLGPVEIPQDWKPSPEDLPPPGKPAQSAQPLRVSGLGAS